MPGIEIEIDSSDIEKKLEVLKDIKKGTPAVLKKSMNETLKEMKPAAAGIIRDTYTIKVGEINKHLDIKDRATLSKLSVSLRSTGRPRSAVKFKHRKNTSPGRKGGSPAFLQVERSSGGNLLSGGDGHSTAFVATMASGRKGLFQRTGKVADSSVREHAARVKNVSKYNRRANREVLSQVWSPGIMQMLNNRVTREEVQDHFAELFNKKLDANINKMLDGQSG